MFLDVFQQFVFMHWLWVQYRELRLNKLAHAAAALSVAFGYNCGMGDIRTTTEAQGKERWSIATTHHPSQSWCCRRMPTASRALLTSDYYYWTSCYRFYYLIKSPWLLDTFKTSTANNCKWNSNRKLGCIRVCVWHQRSFSPSFQPPRRQRINKSTS